MKISDSIQLDALRISQNTVLQITVQALKSGTRSYDWLFYVLDKVMSTEDMFLTTSRER